MRAEWKIPNGYNVTFISQKLPLIILWDFTIHKAQGKTLDYLLIYLRISEKRCGVTLADISSV